MTAVPAQLATATDAAAANVPTVLAESLEKWIDERPVLREINFQITPGRYVALLGANGAGKSTLLRLLSTLTTPTAGRLSLFGEKSTSPSIRRRIGLIGHQSMLYRDLSARENLEFFAKLYGIPDPAARATALLEEVDLSHRADDPVKSFSRGMTQRLAIARALVHDPELLLADEPFDGLDAPSSRALEKLLAALHHRGKTIVLANHDIPQTLRLVERVIVLRAGEIALDQSAWNITAEQVLAEMEQQP
jgi:heme ABC exporter ATP-binding subunit CcmA